MKLLLIFILVFVLLFVFKSSREHYNSPKIVHLILYSPDYKEMYEATRDYYKATGIPTYYYSFSKDLSSPHEIQGDRLLIKGEESYLPGVLEKTLASFRIFTDYNYIIRSNASTVVDVKQLVADLGQHPVDYAGSFVHELRWLDPGNGIRDKTYWGTRYASGTCIILSKKAVEILLSSNIDKSVIDDVAIGVALNKHFSPRCYLSRFTVVENSPGKIGKLFYRHRTNNRAKDAENMKWLSKTLIHSL